MNKLSIADRDAWLGDIKRLLSTNDARAETQIRRLLDAAPECAEAWALLAHCVRASGRDEEALQFLQNACRADPKNAVYLYRLGVVAEALGYRAEALQALQFAMELSPGLHQIPLKIGQVLESAGDFQGATRAYMRALMRAQLDGQWLDEESTPPQLRAAVAHAAEFARQGRIDLILGLLDPLFQRYGRDAMRRVERSLLGYLEIETWVPQNPLQRPKFLYCPELPSPAYFDRDLFPWFSQLEAAYPQIRAEAEAVLADPASLKPFLALGMDEDIGAYLAGKDAAPSWDAFFFYRYGNRYGGSDERCPRTSAVLDRLPLIRIPGHAPEICFSVLAPGTHILPHYGVTNARIVVHLPLIVPSDCALRVGGEEHHWRPAECVAFDDTFLHEAWNRSGEVRAILLMDAWNPYLTDAERAAFADIIEGIGAVNRG